MNTFCSLLLASTVPWHRPSSEDDLASVGRQAGQFGGKRFPISRTQRVRAKFALWRMQR